MAYAMMYPEAKRGGNRKTDQVEKNQLDKPDLDKATISRARFIFNHDKEKADLVRDGHPDYSSKRRYEVCSQSRNRSGFQSSRIATDHSETIAKSNLNGVSNSQKNS